MRFEKPLLLRVYDPNESCQLAVYDLAEGQDWLSRTERTARLAKETPTLSAMQYAHESVAFIESTYDIPDDEKRTLDDLITTEGWALLDAPIEIDDQHVMHVNDCVLVAPGHGVYWIGVLPAYSPDPGELTTTTLFVECIQAIGEEK
jgi:hypothetical protein